MSVDITSRDSSAPTTADVRAAAEALKQAIDRHLQAVENRGGEQDEQVQDTYAALHAAAEVYDDLLFEVHDEVTPFSFVSAPVEGPQGGEVDSISIVARRDYDIADGERLLSAGRALFAADTEAADVVESVDDASSAVAVLFDRYEPKASTRVLRSPDCSPPAPRRGCPRPTGARRRGLAGRAVRRRCGRRRHLPHRRRPRRR